MRIGIMAEFLGTKIGGTATYTRSLLRGLAELGPEQHEFRVYVADPVAAALVPSAPNISVRPVGPYAAAVRIPFTLPLELVRHPVDLLHAQGWGPLWSACPMTVTVHDLSWEVEPTIWPARMRWRMSFLVRRSVDRAVRVIASSQSTARDLERYYGVPAAKIRVVYPPFDASGLRPAPDEAARVRAHYRFDAPYVLYVGSVEPRKNVGQLIKAYARARREARVTHELVIAGKPLRLAAPILDLPRTLGIERHVRFLGAVPARDLAGLYSGADAFAFLAAHEGFGYPPLEAMACGVPALVADRASLPEVVGDAAVLVDPDREEDVARELERILRDGALRARLAERAPGRLARYAPAAAAARVVEIYEECATSPRLAGEAAR